MKKVCVQELSEEKFKKYGSFAQMINPDAEFLGQEPIQFYRDILQYSTNDSNICFSVTRAKKREMIIDYNEFHSYCYEALLPLDGDVIIHVAPATSDANLPVDKVELYRVPKGTMIVLRPGVWHFAPFPINSGCVNTLVVLPERTYANDCQFFCLENDDCLEVTGL